MKQISSIPHDDALMIFDSVNNIPGSYCVGYIDENNTSWYWNQNNGGTFEEFGTLIYSRAGADALLQALRRAHHFYVAAKTTINDLNSRNCELEGLVSQALNETKNYMRELEIAHQRIADLEAFRSEVRKVLDCTTLYNC